MMAVDKSYVGVATCFFCGEAKEVILDRRLRNTLPREACYDKEPCSKCQGWMEQGVILISVKDGGEGDNPYRTGGWCVVTKEAFARAFPEVEETGVAFVPDAVWQAVGLPERA